jgi:cysteine synthase B
VVLANQASKLNKFRCLEQERNMVYKTLIDLIGNTPMVELKKINPNPRVKIYAKLEGQNPTGSLKDRIVKSMVEAAEQEGKLKPGMTLLEPTSGNTGISLAMIATIKGYRVVAVMPENVSEERRELLRAYGAELVLTPGEEGTNGAIRIAHQMVKENPAYFMLDQYSNENNPRAHYETTADEILRDVEQVDVFVAGLGTGGTLMGVGRRLREVYPKVRVVAVQPYPKGGLQGLRNITEGYIPPILNLDEIDESVVTKDEEAFETLKELIWKEGIFAGISSGAVVYECLKIAARMKSGVIVTVLADGGWKYLSDRIWTEEAKKVSERFEGPMW